MSQFVNLRYVTTDGLEAPFDPSHPDSPYHHDWYQSEIGRKVRQSHPRKLRWEYGGSLHEGKFDWLGNAVLDTKNDLLVVILHYNDPQYKRPNNAIVLNPDGSLNHQIISPQYVELSGGGHLTELHPVEAIWMATIQNERIAIDLNFQYEWIERRYYDPATRQWQERDQVYRK